MRVLVMDDNYREELKSLREHAETHAYSFSDMLGRMKPGAESPGDNPRFFRELPVGIKVVFTVEEHPKRMEHGVAKLRHMSMSVDAEDKLPHPVLIQEVMNELGFKGKLGTDDPRLYVHTMEEGCINVLEQIEDNESA